MGYPNSKGLNSWKEIIYICHANSVWLTIGLQQCLCGKVVAKRWISLFFPENAWPTLKTIEARMWGYSSSSLDLKIIPHFSFNPMLVKGKQIRTVQLFSIAIETQHFTRLSRNGCYIWHNWEYKCSPWLGTSKGHETMKRYRFVF